MTDFQRGIITLLKCAVTGEPEYLPEGFDLEEAEVFAKKQNIVTLVYYGAVICGIPKSHPVMQRLFPQYIKLMLRSERQLAELEKIFQAFDEQGIDHLPLKGVNMKKLYPKHELRFMADADILIKDEQYDKIWPIMESYGYSKKNETLHDYMWCKPGSTIELHKRLFDTDILDLTRYFGNGWSFALPGENHRHHYSMEDAYLYQFSHFAKHYRYAGIGCHLVFDLWVYRTAHPDMDADYIRNELRKLHFDVFHDHICALLDYWFYSSTGNEICDYITNYIFSGGAWGSKEINILSFAIPKNNEKQTGRISAILRRTFCPLENMQIFYPVLKKYPFLLPFFWIVRVINAVFFNKTKRANAVRMLKTADAARIDDFHKSLQYVGLDFHYTE